MATQVTEETVVKKSPLQEIVQPFIDLAHAPRALWGINLAYVLEGMVYFGVLSYLAKHFSDFIFAGMAHADVHSHNMVMVLTAGITISMFFLGFVADKWGVRRALIAALSLMLVGRALISAAPTVLNLQPSGLWSQLHLVTMGGILLVVIGYGMYQPAAYAGVRQITTPKTAGMAFAMLYALMNLGGWLPTFAFLLRDDDYLGMGIPGVYWVYTGFTLIALLSTVLILSARTFKQAREAALAETAALNAAEQKASAAAGETKAQPGVTPEELVVDARIPWHMWLVLLGILVAIYFRAPEAWRYQIMAVVFVAAIAAAIIPKVRSAVAQHPLANSKFFFFIFALMPVQTLFTYNWLILPQYISRAYEGWIGRYFEIASNANPILIFILVPIIAAATQKAKVYNMMVIGTLIMAAPAFLLAIGPYPLTLAGYILIMTIGEAMWQPRFLQYAAEIAPEGRTGQYMGVAQLPWFLTKMLVPLLYSGIMLEKFCPADGVRDTRTMWLIFACIACTTPVLLLLAKGWVGRDFKTKAA